jgi:hypothetical protein
MYMTFYMYIYMSTIHTYVCMHACRQVGRYDILHVYMYMHTGGTCWKMGLVLCLTPSLSLSLTLSHTHAHAHVHIFSLSLSLSLSLSRSLSLSLSLSLYLPQAVG